MAVYAIPADIDDPPETAKQVSKILGLDVEAVRKKLSEPLATVWIDRRVDPEKAAALRKLNPQRDRVCRTRPEVLSKR